MASRPHLAKLSVAIEQLGGDEYIFAQVADGVPMKKIAEPFGYSRGLLYTWIKAGGPDREAAFKEARAISAHSLVEDAGDDLEAKPATSADATMAIARSKYKMGLAGLFNRADYGEESGKIDVNLNIGQLHLQALQAHGHRKPLGGRDLSALPPAEDTEA